MHLLPMYLAVWTFGVLNLPPQVIRGHEKIVSIGDIDTDSVTDDGSDLVSYALQRERTAAQVFKDIKVGNGFKQIDSLDDIHPGDVIAIKYVPNAILEAHIMLVYDSHVAEFDPDSHDQHQPSPIVYGTYQYSVAVLDVTKCAFLRLYCDHNGSIVGHATMLTFSRPIPPSLNMFSLGWFGNGHWVSQEVRPLVIGRPDGLPTRP